MVGLRWWSGGAFLDRSGATITPLSLVASLLPLLVACAGDDPAPGEPIADAGPDLVAYVGSPVDFDGSGSEHAASSTWTFGDGATGDGETAQHTYEAPGHYAAYVTVTGADGRTDSDELRVTAVWPPLDDPPRAASSIAADGERVYVAMPDFDRVAVLDRAGLTLTEHLDTCAGPRSVSVHADLLAVACPDDDAISLFDVTGAPSLLGAASLGWGDRPFGVVVGGADAPVIYASLQGPGEIAAIDPSSLAITDRWPVGPDLRGLAWVDGAILVSRHRSPDDAGYWWRLDPTTGDVTENTLAHSPGPDSDTDARGLPNYLQRIAVRPDGRAAAFPGLKSNIDRGEHREGQPLTSETTARSTLRHAGLGADAGLDLEEPLFDNRDLAVAATYSPLGDYLYVAHLGAEVIDVLDAVTTLRAGGFQDAGGGIAGLVALDEALWVDASFDRAVRVYDASTFGATQTELARIDLAEGLTEPLSEALALGRQVFHRAADPRMSRDAYISCASCHLDGHQDGRTWDITDRGEGLRNTIALSNRGGDAEIPIHWSANFDEVQDFERDIRLHLGGDGFLSEDDWATYEDPLGAPKAGLSPELDALAEYVASLQQIPRSPYREADGSLSEQARWGEEIFLSEETGCADCHPPPTYTNAEWLPDGSPLVYDVGTLTPASGERLHGELAGLDTPTLRGLHDTAPYLHDGSAETLEDVFAIAGDGMGSVSQLSEEELAALVAFLLSLE